MERPDEIIEKAKSYKSICPFSVLTLANWIEHLESQLQPTQPRKTVKDAVEYFGREWPNTHSKRKCAIGVNKKTGSWVVWEKGLFNNKTSYVVCDGSEFEAEVERSKGEEWTHTFSGVKGKIIGILDNGENLFKSFDGGLFSAKLSDLKKIKPTISKAEAWDKICEVINVTSTPDAFKCIVDNYEVK